MKISYRRQLTIDEFSEERWFDMEFTANLEYESAAAFWDFAVQDVNGSVYFSDQSGNEEASDATSN